MLMEERDPTGAAGDPATMARGIGGNSLVFMFAGGRVSPPMVRYFSSDTLRFPPLS
jgi:hypothetical protein